MLKPILWRRVPPPVWVPGQDGTMLQVDRDAPLFVREADYADTVEAYETELRQARANEADARQSAMETSQREARWMMIEQRLKTTISTICGYVVADIPEKCTCPRCVLARELWGVLNSDPPVGAGFVSETPNSVLGQSRYAKE